MSENQDCGIRNHSKYDTMDTETLEEILRLDSEAPEGQESDTELILYIMEVLAKRKKLSSTGKTAQQAWESFQQHYLPQEEEIAEKPLKSKKINKSFSSGLRWLIAAAAVVALLVGLSVAAGALRWEEIWNTVAKWAKETFSFVSPDQTEQTGPSPDNINCYTALQEALAAEKRETDIVPTWIPEGYIFNEIIIEENPMQKVYVALYSHGETILKIHVQAHLMADPERVEANEDLLEVYQSSGVDYYILANHQQLRAVWIKGSYECYISGELTVEEIKLMIDSIGKG